jgi:hypothetical protein
MNIPSSISTAKTFFLVSAILNLLYSLFWIFYVLVLGTATCGIGCIFFIIPVVNIVACIMDFIAYNKLNTLTAYGTYNSMQFASIMDIASSFTGNVVSMVFGIITLINLNQDETKRFLQERNIY